MDAVFKKLNYKGQENVVIINSPDSFEVNIRSLEDTSKVLRSTESIDLISFAVAFATKQVEVDKIAETIGPKLHGDAVFWVCYPKGTSKKYTCDFNRDTGWASLGEYNLEGVRMVAIDEDWSALRFRKVQFIKKMTRREGMALSKDGKKRTSGK